VKRHNTTRRFATAVSEAWADMRNASRLLVEHQMGPRSHR
jgi:hypothetical protein